MSAKIFFSYSRTDSEFALKLAKDLRNAGADLWIDQLDIYPGTRWDVEVEKALRGAETVIVILSPAAVASQNIMDEVSYALEEHKRVIPIVLARCEMPFRLKRLQYIDFVEGYEDDFAQLCKVLDLSMPGGGVEPPVTKTVQRKSASRAYNTGEKSYKPETISLASGKQMPRKWLYLGGGVVVLLILLFFLFRGGDETSATKDEEQEKLTNPAPSVINADSVFTQAKYEEDSNKNFKLAANLYRIAAEAGNRDAMYALTLIYEYNIPDFDSVMYWCQRGAYAGEPYAMKEYGNLLTNGSEEFPLRRDRINKDSGAYWLNLLKEAGSN